MNHPDPDTAGCPGRATRHLSLTLAASFLALGSSALAAPQQKQGRRAHGPDIVLQSRNDCVSFSDLETGAIPIAVFGDQGTGPIRVKGYNPALGNTNAAVIFDSANPTGEDPDLGTPNEDFGGPGIGVGGEAGSPFQNDQEHGKIIIIGEDLVDDDNDGLVDDPDDADLDGSTLEFDFAPVGPVIIKSITQIDTELDRANPLVDLYDDSNTLLLSFQLEQPGDNGVAVVNFPPNGNVSRMVINLTGSSGFDDLCFELFKDCNDNGVHDRDDIKDGTSNDCNRNRIPDECEPDCDDDGIPDGCEADCDNDGTPDDCEDDCDGDGTPDDCEDDCDNDGTPDDCEADCDGDGIPDDCEADCDGDGTPDDCELDCDGDGTPDDCEDDCDGDGTPDDCEDDCDGDGVPDDCEGELDCNVNGIPDSCDITDGTSNDCDGNGVPDECQADCDSDGLPDACEPDCDGDGTPDNCELDCDGDGTPDDCEDDCDGDGIPDDCEADCDGDGIPDDCENDCNGDGIPDDCEVDCDGDGTPDGCEADCDGDGTPDDCEADCDGDGIPDDCEADCDGDGTPDDCEVDCDGDGTPDDCEVDCDGDGTPDDCEPDCDSDGIPDDCEVDCDGSGTPDDCETFEDCNGNGVPDQCEDCGGAVGDLVWNDVDCDGIQDAGEPGIAGVKVTLVDSMMNEFVTFTDSSGNYSFTGLCAGTYHIDIDAATLPSNFVPTACNVGSDDAVDNDCSPAVVTLDSNCDIDLTIDFGFKLEPRGDEGCTPGYWKQPHHFDSWVVFTPDTLFSDVFEDAFPGMTLLQVLETGGGDLEALGRHTVAALLNSTAPGVGYMLTTTEVVSMFNDVYPGGDYETLKNLFQGFNESGCPLN